MDDGSIIRLFEERDEQGIAELETKYSAYLRRIAKNVLRDGRDAEECVNDTYLKVWNRIPPEKPDDLPAFIGKIARDSAIDSYRSKTAKKRRGSEYESSLDELSEVIPSHDTTEGEVNVRLLHEAIASYLLTLSEKSRNMFIRRYYFFDSAKLIAETNVMSVSAVRVTLFRIREGLREYLEKEGFGL